MSQPPAAPVTDDVVDEPATSTSSTSSPAPSPAGAAHREDRYAGRALRWGFIGAGRIAGAMAQAIAETDGHELVHVGARDADRAAAFAAEHAAAGTAAGTAEGTAAGAARSSGDYAAVCDDPEVDVIYLNTTHPHHRDQALRAIAGGKHLLVEKPLALNAEQATEVFEAAARAGVFVMEAMWMRTQPVIREVEKILAAGEIGDLVRVAADFAVPFDYDPEHRLFDLDNGGGALLDLGVYASHFVWLFLGEPETVHVMGSLAPTGADQVVSMQWGYDNGAIGSVFCTSRASGPHRGMIMGRDGWISVEPSFAAGPTTAIVHVGGHRDFDERTVTLPTRRYGHELDEVSRCLRAGLLESPLVPHADTIGVLEILDAARSELGVHYPQETRRPSS